MIRDIAIEEYNELMAFLSDKTKQLFFHEVAKAVEKNEKPKNEFQELFHRLQCCASEMSGMTVYRVYTKGFLTFVRVILPVITKKEPNVFKNYDARDILMKLNEISGYAEFHKGWDDYLDYLSKLVCVYIVLKKDGHFKNNILRIDLCRDIQPDRKNPHIYEFRGGLLHAAKHFSIETTPAIDSIAGLELLLAMCTNAFVQIPTNHDKNVCSIKISYDEIHSMLFGFYREESTNVYYINTIHLVDRKK